MRVYAKDGRLLIRLIEMAVPLCRLAEKRHPRTGPGRKPEIPDWAIAVLIVVAVLKLRKSKSAQFRFLHAHRRRIVEALGIAQFPSRTTYFDRYRRAWPLFEMVIAVAGERAIRKGYAPARCVAVDKSVIPTRGPLWNRRHQAAGTVPCGADLDATWTYSKHDGWTLGYGYEVVVTAEKQGPVWPLLASAGPASWQPSRTFPEKIPHLPRETRYVLADSAYDSNDLAVAVEDRPQRGRTGCRLLCPYAKHRSGTADPAHRETKRRKARRLRRRQRYEFLQRRFAKRLLRRRGTKVEPFNDWFKSRFDLHHQVWHRGLMNNRTQLLAAIFAYQLLLLYNHALGNLHGCIQWIIDSL